MPKLFTAAQLAPHVSHTARWWHSIRAIVAPFAAWRTIQEAVTFTGTIVAGEINDDGDTNFQLYVLPFLLLHCEVDPVDLDRLRPSLAALEAGQRAAVTGRFVVDLGHGNGAAGSVCQLEVHPVEAIVTLAGLEPAA